jgi:YHS domain-containing protein
MCLSLSWRNHRIVTFTYSGQEWRLLQLRHGMGSTMKQLAAVLLALLLSLGALAETSINTVGSDDRTAISGYDPVGFLVQKKALPGIPALSFEYAGAKWLFSTPENLEAFRSNPDQFIPAWGGQCAWAISENTISTKKLSGQFEIIDGKAYLFAFGNNSKTSAHDDFMYGRTSRSVRLREGEKNWLVIKQKLEDGSLVQPNSSNYSKSRFE